MLELKLTQCRKTICKTVDFISRIKVLNAIDYRVKRIMWMLGPL